MRQRALIGLLALVFPFTGCATDQESKPNAPATASDAVSNQTKSLPGDESARTAPTNSPVVVGELAADFPIELFALADDDEVLLSSLAPAQDGLWALSLNVRTDAPAQEILPAYEKSLKAAGFKKVSTAQVEGMNDQVSFANGDQFLTVGILEDTTARIITVGGTIKLDE